MKKILSISIIASVLFTGCSFSNPFGIGEEKSACEVSSGFGVCGSPKKIYTYRDKIKKMQSDYMQSGYEDELFFAISDSGEILVKEERDDSFQIYRGSEFENKINSLLDSKKELLSNMDSGKKITVDTTNVGQDIPVTNETDLSIKYQEQRPIIETRSSVGDFIRDNGLIQKVWIAPFKDDKGSLISAQEVYLVIKEADWIVGEETPRTMKRTTQDIPTPMSNTILEKIDSLNENEEKIVTKYNKGDESGIAEIISKENKKTVDSDLNLINNYINEQK